jgi:hypothetical protein
MPKLTDAELTAVIEQWDQHDRFRDFDNSGEPIEVRLARELQSLRTDLEAKVEEWRQRADDCCAADTAIQRQCYSAIASELETILRGE